MGVNAFYMCMHGVSFACLIALEGLTVLQESRGKQHSVCNDKRQPPGVQVDQQLQEV